MKIKHTIYYFNGNVEEKTYSSFQESQEGFQKTLRLLEVKDIKLTFILEEE